MNEPLASRRLIKTPRDAEIFARDYLTALGFSGAVVVGGTGDRGIDVRADEVLAQVKFEGIRTTTHRLQALYGNAQHEKKFPAFFSLGGYTKDALLWGSETAMALFEFDYAGDIVARSSVAAGWVDRAFQRELDGIHATLAGLDTAGAEPRTATLAKARSDAVNERAEIVRALLRSSAHPAHIKPGWGVEYFVAELARGIAHFEPLYERFSEGKTQPHETPIPVSRLGYDEQMEAFRSHMGALPALFKDPALGKAAFGADWYGGDEGIIREQAAELAAIYGALLKWGTRMAGAIIPPPWDAAYRASAELTKVPLRQLRKYSGQISAEVPEFFATARAGTDPGRPLGMAPRVTVGDRARQVWFDAVVAAYAFEAERDIEARASMAYQSGLAAARSSMPYLQQAREAMTDCHGLLTNLSGKGNWDVTDLEELLIAVHRVLGRMDEISPPAMLAAAHTAALADLRAGIRPLRATITHMRNRRRDEALALAQPTVDRILAALASIVSRLTLPA